MIDKKFVKFRTMEKIRKYAILGFILIALLIPMLFGIYIEYLFIRELNYTVIFIVIFGLFIFLILDKLIAIYGYNYQSFNAIKEQDVIIAFTSRNDKAVICGIFLPMIMIIEELIFRYYMIGFLLNQVRLDVISAILISSIIFSLFHIHIWFRFKNLKLLLINLGDSFLLGVFNGYILLTLGLIPCILIHYILVLILYYNIYKRYFKNKIK